MLVSPIPDIPEALGSGFLFMVMAALLETGLLSAHSRRTVRWRQTGAGRV